MSFDRERRLPPADARPIGGASYTTQHDPSIDEYDDRYDELGAVAEFDEGQRAQGESWGADGDDVYYEDDPIGEPSAGAPRPPDDGRENDRDDPADFSYDDYFDDADDEEFEIESNATRNAVEWAVVLVGAVLVALLLRASLFQAFWIPSESMETTLLIDDRVLVNKLSYRLHDVNRGDVIVFARPEDDPAEIRDLIKRVIALPGEKVEGRNNEIYINDKRLLEPYLDEGIETSDFGPTVVPVGELFVMGDNRGESYDSRLFGAISEERVVGRAFFLFWPLDRIGSL